GARTRSAAGDHLRTTSPEQVALGDPISGNPTLDTQSSQPPCCRCDRTHVYADLDGTAGSAYTVMYVCAPRTRATSLSPRPQCLIRRFCALMRADVAAEGRGRGRVASGSPSHCRERRPTLPDRSMRW